MFSVKYKHVRSQEMDTDEILWGTAGVLPKGVTNIDRSSV